ncbi:MAG: SDR family oxidoreductase [Actinomycetota bacterium]|nr:SDR family oxidoreductase [Actinomycetota bacterium]
MSDLGFDGKVAVITGAGGGLGREHAMVLAHRGARVLINDLGGAIDGTGGDEGPAQLAANEINDLGGIAIANGDTVATPEGGAAIVQAALEEFGRIDIVINNAGILRDKTFHTLTDDLLSPVVDVHLKGAFYVTRPAWVHMREQGYGRVINTASASGIIGNFGQANYGAAKMGLVGFTNVLAIEGRKHNIKANAIAPIARTRMTEELMGPLADALDPSEVAPLVSYLAHEDCPVSGETFSVGGGRVARFFVGLTRGWCAPGHSMEDIRDNWDDIENQDGYLVPEGTADEFRLLAKMIQEAQ